MIFRVTNRKTLFRVGSLFLLLAFGWHWFIHPNAALSEGLVDGVHGLFIGLAIGTLLLSIIRSKPDRCDAGSV